MEILRRVHALAAVARLQRMLHKVQQRFVRQEERKIQPYQDKGAGMMETKPMVYVPLPTLVQ